MKIPDIELLRDRYRKKFGQLDDPVAHNAPLVSLWPQIPLYRTLLVRLSPLTAEHFDVYHGFGASSVSRLVDFAKDSKRAVFLLEDDPIEYAGLDFLDPVFTEMSPHQEFAFLKCSEIRESKKFKDELVRFDTLSRVRFYDYLANLGSILTTKQALGPTATPFSMVDFVSHDFAALGLLGYDDLQQMLADAMVEDPSKAMDLFLTLRTLVVGPRTDLLGAIYNISREQTEATPASRSWLVQRSTKTPLGEIGKYLLRKLAPYPESLEACRVLCDNYKQHDLYSVAAALQEAVSTEDYSGVRAKSQDLSEILDKIWNDASTYGKRKDIARGGITIGMAVLGTVIAGPIGALGGVLASLGYNVIEKLLEIKTDSISERIAKSLTSSCLISIFEFEKKYPQTSKI
jgi:hypothetical protein